MLCQVVDFAEILDVLDADYAYGPEETALRCGCHAA